MTRAVALIAGLLVAAPALAAKPTVAILYFDYDKDDDLAQLKKGLAQMLISDLAGHDKVTLVERARLQDVLAELQLEQSVRYGKALEALDKKDKEGAKKELLAVTKAQPDFELAALDLATMMK